MAALKLKKGDLVVVRTGKDKGKRGEIIQVLPELNRVVVDGVNIQKRHQKPTPQNTKGGIVETPQPLDASNVGLVDPENKDRPARVGYKVKADGSKVRVYKGSGKEVKGNA